MAAVLRQESGRACAPEGKALAAWLAPKLTYAGKLHNMERRREPELMDDEAQARAYAKADFNDSDSNFIELFRERFADAEIRGYVIDLGCGPGNVSFRFAHAFPECIVHGVDGSEAMLRYGRRRLEQEQGLQGRIEFIQGVFPGVELSRDSYDIIISNSMLHHLGDPQVLWSEIKRLGHAGTLVFIMDLRRPSSPATARLLVDRHAGREPAILRRDFYNSLLASFREPDVLRHLERAGLEGFKVSEIGDRHLIVWGILP
jgi:SAM-dependent methyltransferase